MSPISPSEVDNYTRQELGLTGLYNVIDGSLKRQGVVASATVHTKMLPDLIANEICQTYRKVGWVVSFNHNWDRNESWTSFVFLRSAG